MKTVSRPVVAPGRLAQIDLYAAAANEVRGPQLALVPEPEPVPEAPARHAAPGDGEARGDSSTVLTITPFARGRHVRAPEVGAVRPPAAARFA